MLHLCLTSTSPVRHQSDASIGLSLMDRFTSAMLDFFQAAMARAEDKTAHIVRGFSGSTSAPSILRDDVGWFVYVLFLLRVAAIG